MNKFKTIGLGLVTLFAVSCVATSCGGGGEDNSESIVFHYHREDSKYTGWDLWLWPDGGNGAGYEFNKDVDDYGAVAKYPVSTWPNSTGINFIVRQGGSAWSAKDPDGDRSLLFADFPVD